MTWAWAPWWHWLVMAGVWIVGMGLIMWAITTLFPTGPHRDPRPDPRRILDVRFARGQIDTDQYRELRDELDTHARPAARARA